jgi:hypothetical protein
MTISVKIENTMGPTPAGADARKVRVTYVYKGAHGHADQVLKPDLGPGESTTVHIHTGADIRLEEVDAE